MFTRSVAIERKSGCLEILAWHRYGEIENSNEVADFEAISARNSLSIAYFGLKLAHIINVHHAYVERRIPTLKLYLAKLEKVHFNTHPDLKEMHRLFVECATTLTVPMKKEELLLFPYIKSMEKAKKEGVSLPTAHFGHIDHPIHMMEEDHEAEGARFAKLTA